MFISNENLNPWIIDILNHCTPDTEHKQLLNNLSLRQISHSTYLENHLPSIASDANFIVPRSLYECKTNQMWRYPPHIYADFVVESSDESTISIAIRFAIPRFIRYGERLQKGPRRFKKRPTISLPDGFGRVNLFGHTYDMKLDEELTPTSVEPKLFETSVKLKIRDLLNSPNGERLEDILNLQEQIIVIKKFDANTNQVEVVTGEDPTTLGHSPPSGSDNQNINIGYIELVGGPSKASVLIGAKKIESNKYRISVRLTNEENYNKENPKTGEWMRRSLLLPNLLIKIEEGKFLLPLQQHFESLQYVIDKGEEKLATTYDDNYYTQVNGVLTKSMVDPSLLCLATFGIFDTIREIPVAGPTVADLIGNDELFFSNLTLLTEEEKNKLRSNPNWIKVIKSVLKAAASAFNVQKNFYKFQWDAIQNRLRIILNNESGTTTIIKAPTASGKTLVFMVNAVLHSLLKGERSVLVFPTRILNEDMFRRLTKFVYEMRSNMPGQDITGGIYIGQSDPLYKALSNPSIGSTMIQFDTCPSCGRLGSIIAKEEGKRKVGECSNKDCGHVVNYMFSPRDAPDYLPLITIATPDNLFYYSTNYGPEEYPLRFFGGYFIKCQCGYCHPAMDRRSATPQCKACNRTLELKNKETSPIGYFVFDEIHSLYGLTGILLSIYLKALEILPNKIVDLEYHKKPLKWKCTFETGTATIANEQQLLKVITRASQEKIMTVPKTADYFQYFEPKPSEVKYRTVIMLPVARSARTSVSNALLRLYYSLHIDRGFSQTIRDQASNSYDFILGYLFKKNDGYTLRRTISDLAKQELGQNLDVNFLSGDATTSDVANLFQMAKNAKIKMLLANLIISLGIDISNMNNMIMMGLPKSMTEFVQTAGRTGRGLMPGHTTVHLLPTNPRDMYTLENFHKVFTDVSGYFESKPIQSTNAYAAKIIFPNILKLMLAALSYEQYVLTIPSAKMYFRDTNARTAIKIEVLKALIDADTPESVKKIIWEQVNDEFDEFLMKWMKISGQGNYMSQWFKTEGHILGTLRENTNKDIPVHIDDIELYAKVSSQFKPPWFTSPEEDVQDNDSEEEEENE